MEGPSLHLAAHQLAPFKKKIVRQVAGITKTVPLSLLKNRRVKDLFSWGKHLVLQFDRFALRVHFLMFGSYEATVNGKSVTGDYKRAREPRLSLVFKNGRLDMFSCSIKVIETSDAKADYDFSADLMSPEWNPRRALKKLRNQGDAEVGDALLDQDIFAGLGNIIKNEILLLARVRPVTPVARLSNEKQKELVRLARTFSLRFYEWRKNFVLRKNLKAHRKRLCALCRGPLIRAKTGTRQRWSYYCPVDQM